MTDDQYCPLLDEQTSNSTVNTGYDFNKYDPYVEKIRTLFVPSLEPRIYSCLETFVYREDHEALLEPPYLKRCLDMAETWREPVYAFSTKLGDRRFLEKMLTQTVGCLIKDGLIDCFLNSIILNNRLNKICRNLDAACVQKDFLRHLAVWNYINEKDYWVENDTLASTSMLSPSYDLIESYSDLDVQVGSGLDSERTKRRYKQPSERPAIESSEFIYNDVNEVSRNCCSPEFCRRFDIDSKNPKRSKSSWIRNKLRSISQTYPCRPSNCPYYRKKNSQQSDWEGKTLKLRVCKISSNCPTNSDRVEAKPCRLSRLPLPCKFDDIIADIFKADHSVPRLSSITASKKLRASVTDICRCINETLGKMSREEVKRCRFHCEILPGLVNFKLVQRESNGCKACLFSDRIAIDRIDGQFTPRTSQFNKKFENIEEENPDTLDLPIFESTRMNLVDKDSRPVSSVPIETKNGVEPEVTNSIRLTERELDVSHHQKSKEFFGGESSNELNKKDNGDQFHGCSSSFIFGCENRDHKEEGNTGTNRVERSETTADQNNSVKLSEKAALIQSSGNAIHDGSCYCNNSDNNELEIFNRGLQKPQRADCDDNIEGTMITNLGEKMTPEDCFNHLSGNEAEDQICHCSDSFPYTHSINRDPEKNEDSKSIECLETYIEDIEALNCEESCQDTCAIIPGHPKMNSTGKTSPAVDYVENDQPLLTNQLRVINSPSEEKNRNGMANEIQRNEIRSCECPASCECINKRSDEREVEDCDSQCSCDTCGAPEKSRSLNPASEGTRISSLLNPDQPPKVNSSIPNFERPIIIEKRKCFDTAGTFQLQLNGVESDINSWNSHHPKSHQDTSPKSKISLASRIANTSFLDAEIEETFSTRTNLKSMPIPIEKPSSSPMKETTRRLSLPKSPALPDTKQGSYDDQHEIGQCDSQCLCDTCEPLENTTPFNRISNVTRIPQLANSKRPSNVDSLVPNAARPFLIKEKEYCRSTNVEFQPTCFKSEINSRDSHHPKSYQGTSAKSKISLPAAVSKAPLSGTWCTCTSFKSVQTVTENIPSSIIKETKKTLSLARSPIQIDTKRASSSRSQRINISIELCSESQSSGDRSSENKPMTMLPLCPNGSIRSGDQDLSSMLRPRCHSADTRISRKQAMFKSNKNTNDEYLRHLRGINACLHSPPRPLESRDYLPPSQPPLRMGNPIVYGMSTKSERQSMRQHKRRKNGLKYSKINENSQCCNEYQKNGHIEKPDELPKHFSPASKKSKNVSSSVIHNNLCHAFSASSVDRMKHLIKTKLRRILLERDKATNTPKISLANEKYRVSVPNGKTKRLPFPRQRCRTIWESRSASASTHTSKTFGSNARSLAKVSEGDKIKTLFDSTTNSKIVSSVHKDLEECQDSDKIPCYCSRGSDQSVVSSRIADQRLVGGSDAPCQKGTDRELRYLWKQRQESVQKITNMEVQYVYNRCDDRFSSKSINHSFTGDSVAENTSSKPLHLCNEADCEEELTLNERQDQIMKCPGKLDWSGNSTSRHIYLYEYDNFESSNDGEANKRWEPKICSSKCNSLPICKQRRKKENPRKLQQAQKTNCRQLKSRSSRRQLTGEQKMSRNVRASSFVSSKIHVTSSIKGRKAFGKLDQDLRSKLLQYVSLCKNVKYSLLKMLRPVDVYDVRRLSSPRTNRYKFGDS